MKKDKKKKDEKPKFFTQTSLYFGVDHEDKQIALESKTITKFHKKHGKLQRYREFNQQLSIKPYDGLKEIIDKKEYIPVVSKQSVDYAEDAAAMKSLLADVGKKMSRKEEIERDLKTAQAKQQE